MAQSVLNGGAGGLRLAGAYHIEAIRKMTDLPIIGITKPDIIPENFKEIVYITPTFADAESIAKAGADIIAIDGTKRPRPSESLEGLIKKIHLELNCAVMADVSNLDEAVNASALGADIISTTLAGYTTYTKATEGPDLDILKSIIDSVDTPVICEGRIETVQQMQQAFNIGAFAVVIGSIITRPHLITKKFVDGACQ